MIRRIRSCILVPFIISAVASSALLAVWIMRGGDQQEAREFLHMVTDIEPAGLVETFIEALPEAAPIPPDAPIASGGTIEILFTGPSPRDHRVVDRLDALIDGAQESILCAWYDVGYEPIANALVQRHQAGVDVRIVSDERYGTREALAICKRAGIPVVLDDRDAFMHNKFCVIDGRTVWTGSTNISSNGFFKNNNNVIVIDSPEISLNFTVEFKEMFDEDAFGPTSRASTPNRIVELGDVIVENYFAPEDDAQERIIHLIGNAEDSIDFMQFAFTSDPVADAMIARMGDGVRVRGVFEDRNAGSDHSEDDRLAAAGALVIMDTNPGAMHHKTVIIDERIVITGSYNLSKSAETSNDENLLVLHSDWIAEAYTKEFQRIARIQ